MNNYESVIILSANAPEESTVAFGDSFNDEEMLENVNYSVAMKNADHHIIKKAKYVTSLTNKEGGVGQFIIDFLNKKIH